jgi:hypothetical protein
MIHPFFEAQIEAMISAGLMTDDQAQAYRACLNQIVEQEQRAEEEREERSRVYYAGLPWYKRWNPFSWQRPRAWGYMGSSTKAHYRKLARDRTTS